MEEPLAQDIAHQVGRTSAKNRDPPRKIEDLIVGDAPEGPEHMWQFNPYGRDSSTWLAAAQRRHQHRRRSNESLGVASVDLSGPHEPTPTVGHRAGQLPGHYFLVLTVQADHHTGYSNGSTQTDHGPNQGEDPEGDVPENLEPPVPETAKENYH